MPGKVRGNLREIHMCESMEELNKRIIVNDSTLPKTPPRMLRSAQMVLDSAFENYHKGDEEAAYVLFMKYLHISQYAQKLPKSQHASLQPLLDSNKLKKIMTTAEQLSSSLSHRYGLLALAKEKELENKRPVTPEPPKLSNPISAINGNEEPLNENFVTSRQLYKLIERYRSSRGLLIMDVRTNKDFKESHLDAPCIINVPEDILQPGKTTSKLEKELPKESLSLWSDRGNCEYVVLMDWSSKFANVVVTTKAMTLRNILEKWDVKIVYKHKPLLLEGGYEDWIHTYPTVTTNPNVRPPSSLDSILNDLLIDNVEYPTWNENSPKQQVMSLPSVDRGLKPSLPPSEITTFISPIINYPPSITPLVNDITPPVAPVVPSTPAPLTSKTTPAGQVEVTSSIPSVNRAAKKDAIERMEREKQRASDEVQLLMKQKADKEKEMEVLRISRIAEAEVEIHRHKENELLAEIENLQKRCQQQENEKQRLQLQLDEARKPEDQNLTPRVPKPSTAPVVPEKPRPSTGVSEIGTRLEALKVDGPTGGLTRSHSTPNINNMDDNLPAYDRGTKPVPRRSQIEPTRHRDFSPVHGSKGRGLTGLKNLGNSCYMNSIVQCISNTISLNQYFCNGEYRNDINLNTRTRGQIVEELAAVVKALWQGDFRTIACRDFKRVAGNYHGDFAGFRQQDSHEFLTLLMDWLHDDLNKRRHIKPPPSPCSEHEAENKRDVYSAASKAWQDFLLCNDSLILQLFYGQQSSTVQCKTCRFESVTFEPFSSLTLVLPSDVDKCSLQECLEMYLAPEPVSEWKCPRCKVARSASKKFDIWRLPRILVIHFKRFYEDVLWRKQHTMVEFPLSRLNMSNFVASSQQSHSYDLYAVSNHYGTMDGGHYTTYSRNSNNKWYKFDDADVSEISESNVRSNAAYILFYTMPAQLTRYLAS